MRIVYSICSSADYGIGHIANMAVQGLREGRHEVALYNSGTFGDQKLRDDDFDLLVKERLQHGGYDALHVWANSGLSSMKVTKSKKLPCILERASTHIEHQKKVMEEECAGEGISGTLIPKVVLNRMEKEYKLADIILCPSVYAALTFPESLHEKVEVVPFGVDTEMFEPNHMRDRRDGFRVLFVGANYLRKGARYLAEAWKDPPAELWTVGHTDLQIRGENVKSFGLAKYDRMPYLMNACDVLVLPSLEEGNALCVNEALACGLPVIVTEECGLWPGWKDGKHGIMIPSKDPAAIVKAVEHLRDNPKTVEKMGRAGRKLAEKYTWQVYGKKLCDIYKKLEK